MRRWGLQHLVQLVVAVLVTLLALTAGATAYGRRDVALAEAALRERIGPAQVAAYALTKAYVDQESGQRGFLLTGDPTLLAPDVSGQQQAARLRAELGRLLKDDPTSLALLRGADAAAQAWRTGYADPEIAARRQHPLSEAELREVVTGGKPAFDQVRTRLNALQEHTVLLSVGQVRRIAEAQRLANVIAAVSVLLALVVAVLTLPLLRRILTRPLVRLLRQVRAVSEGHYEQPIDTPDTMELSVIAEAVERMRRNLLRNAESLVEAQHQMTLLNERDRIAGDLHDLTIQRVFALGLMLQSTASRRPELAKDLDPLVDDTDRIIRELRGVIFGMTHDPQVTDLRSQVTTVVRESERSLGFAAHLEFRGPVDEVAWDLLAPDALATLREALSNVAKHARASAVLVLVSASPDELTLTISDDGRGLSERTRRGEGLRNYGKRAERWGGTCKVTSAKGMGTTVEWRVPASPSDEPAPSVDAG